jgi:fructose-1,6-bisphosphatase II
MEKLAVGPIGRGVVDIRKTPTENLRALAKAKGAHMDDLTAVILDRPRHEKLIEEVRTAGARIRLIRDGDIAGALATCDPATGIDILLGIGGAPEGVLAAAALRCVGGHMQGILRPRNDGEAERARKMGVQAIDHVYSIEELAGGQVMFAATGVTDGALLRGVRFFPDGGETQSMVMRSKSGTSRVITARHRFSAGPNYRRTP